MVGTQAISPGYTEPLMHLRGYFDLMSKSLTINLKGYRESAMHTLEHG